MAFSNTDVVAAVAAVLVLWLWQTWSAFKGAVSTIKGHVGFRHLSDNTSIIPGIFDFSPEKRITWHQKHQVFQKYGCDIISAVSIFPRTRIAFFVADPTAAKEITRLRSRFPKRAKDYKLFELFGPNVVSTEDEPWKRYRKVTAPSYSERANHVVWSESCRIAEGLCDTWGAEHTVNDIVALTFSIALQVISVAGFGVPIEAKKREGHTLSFGSALRTLAQDGFLMLILPSAALRLTRRTRAVLRASGEFSAYLHELIARKGDHAAAAADSEKADDTRADLLSNLLRSNAEEVGDASLTDDELLGNMYIGFLAGHETATHALAFALILLALHPAEQERLHAHILSVLPDRRTPTWQDMSRLKYVSAVVNEALRLFPPVTALPKVAAQNAFLPTAGDARVFVPAGSSVLIDIPAIHYNPKYWEDPHAFRPERFTEAWDADAFLPYGGGAHSCMGRNLFEAEAIALLTILLSKYTVAPRDAPKNMAYPAQAIRVVSNATLTPAPLSLVFRRR